MPIEINPPDPLIDALVGDLRAVRPRRWMREALLLGALVVTEIILFVIMHGARPDMPQAMADVTFWWKAVSIGVLAVLSVAATLVSLDPAVTAARRLACIWQALALATAVALALGWLINAGTPSSTDLLVRLCWRQGVECLIFVVLLSLPPVVVIGALIRRGASTQPSRTALAAGLAAAGIGTLVFSLCCDHDDPLYIAVWYGGAVLRIAPLTRLVLPRLARW